MSSFLDTLKERIVVFDGAMGTNLQVQNLSLEDFGGLRFEGCNENLLVTRPDAVENVHSAFLEVGCDVIETNSFNGTPIDFAVVHVWCVRRSRRPSAPTKAGSRHRGNDAR